MPRQRVSVGQRIDTRLIREEELAADLVRLREMMIDVGAELILFKCCGDHRDDSTGFGSLRADPAAIESAGSRTDQVAAIRKLGLQQRP